MPEYARDHTRKSYKLQWSVKMEVFSVLGDLDKPEDMSINKRLQKYLWTCLLNEI